MFNQILTSGSRHIICKSSTCHMEACTSSACHLHVIHMSSGSMHVIHTGQQLCIKPTSFLVVSLVAPYLLLYLGETWSFQHQHHLFLLKLQTISLSLLLNIGYVSNETNTDVCMYTWRTYSNRCSHIAVQVEWYVERNLHWFIYKQLNRLENIWEWLSDVLKWIGWESSWTILDTLAHIQLQLYEKLSLWDQDVCNVILMFASHLAPYSVNW